MAGTSTKNAGKSPANAGDAMNADVADYRELLIEIVGPVRLGENVKSALATVAQKSGLSERRIRGIWHREVKDLRAKELAKLRRAARQRQELEDAQDALKTLRKRLAACEAALGLPPQDDDRPVADRAG